MTEDQFSDFCTAVAEFATKYDAEHTLDSGPVVCARWAPDVDGFSTIHVDLRWLERTPLNER